MYRRTRYYYLRLILLPDTPHKVALGLAIGIFVGLTPTVLLQTMIAVPIAWLLRGSKVAAAIGVWVSNPLTIPPLYAAFFYVGRMISPFGRQTSLPPNWTVHDLMVAGGDAALAGIIGGMAIGVVAAPLMYWLVNKYIDRLQAWERRKLRERFDLSPPHSG